MYQKSTLLITLLAIALASGCSKKPDDAALVTSIQSQMFSDQMLKDASLQVTSNKGAVTLSGTVPNDAAHLEAYKIASQTPGVDKVDDQITVQAAQAAVVPEPTVARAETPARASAKLHQEKTRKTPRPTQDRGTQTSRQSNDSQFAANTSPPDPTPQPQEAPAPQPTPVAAPAPPPPPPPPPPQPRQVQIPENTTVTIRMIGGVDSSVNHAGEIFHASLEAPLVVGNEVIVPKGANVYVRLSNASSAGKFAGKSELHMELVKLEFQGQSYPLVSSTYSLAGDSRGKDTAVKVGGGAAIGAIIGALAGGGKGAAIGAGVGGAGGGVYQGATHGKQVKIPSETKLDFQLDQPVTVTVRPRAQSSSQ